jgi:hypothetical protein
MTTENKQKTEKNESNVIDDLTLEETKTEDVKGGRKHEFFIAESFGFGVEREMKES